MEKEIKVRKKRFAAFWAAVVMVCTLVVPMITHASEITDGGLLDSDTTAVSGTNISELNNQILDSGQSITCFTTIGDNYHVYYQDYNGTALFGEQGTISVNNSAAYSVLLYPNSLDQNEAFKGWLVSNVYQSSGATSSITLKARIECKINYDLDDGTNAPENPKSYIYGEGADSFANASKEGHDFAGWYSDETFTDKIESIDGTETGVVTLYAKFTPKTYSISYEPNGVIHENAVFSYTYGVGIDSFAPATKEGYNFEGWYRDEDFTTKVESITATDTGNLTLYAKFTRSIHYELNGGTNADSNSTSYVEGVGANLTAASKPGFVFAGWYTDEGFTTKIESIGTEITGDLKLYAKFDIGAIGPYTYDLKKGVQYQLGSATKVSGDSSTYVSGSTFYVPEDGSYTFS